MHLLVKILALCYFGDDLNAFNIEPSFRFRRYKPDLLKLRGSDVPNQITPEVDTWVECKQVSVDKLVKLARYLPAAEIYWFHTAHHFETLLRDPKHRRPLKKAKNLSLIGIDLTREFSTHLQDELAQKNPHWDVIPGNKGLEIRTPTTHSWIEYRNF